MLFNPLRNSAATLQWGVLSFLISSFMVCAPLAQAKESSKSQSSKKVAAVEKPSPVLVKSRAIAKRSVAQRSTTATAKWASSARANSKNRRVAALADLPAKASFGQMAGLHASSDPLDLRSSVALVVDQDTQEILFRKNDQAVLPIASLTKLMTGLVMAEAKLPLHEILTISQDDVDTEKGSSSRLAVGTTLSRGDLLHLALMSSENRAAHALGRTYPGGLNSFVTRMNERAQSLGMRDTRYVEPTGLSSRNQSSANDLALLVGAAYKEPLLRELSTSPGREVDVGRRTLQYNNTNRLVKNPEWDIGIQKTGYISEAGQCLVMQTKVAGRKLIMVFLDSAGKLSRIADAERVRRWLESAPAPRASATSRNSHG
jgi:D-alanyl-D-alanine endopeptidase (penicillin-binding protein 7)